MTSDKHSEAPVKRTHLRNYGGSKGKAIRQDRVDAILLHIFWFHALSPAVIQHLIGISQSNTATLLKSIQQRGLIQKTITEMTGAAPNGYLWMLTEDGVFEVTRADKWLYCPHPYDSRVGSPRTTQLAHDMTVAQLAATLVVGGARIVATDFSARMDAEPKAKIADLIVEIDGQQRVVEYERTLKSIRDTQIALTNTIKLKVPALVVCATRYISNRWRQMQELEEIPKWERSPTSGRWIQTDIYKVTADQRRRVTILDEPLLDAWIDLVLSPAADRG